MKKLIHGGIFLLLSVASYAGENSFIAKQPDGSGHYVWGEAINWGLERVPSNQDVVQIGHNEIEVDAYVKSSGMVARALEIAEYGQDGGETNSLSVTSQGELTVSGLVSVGKDKHGILNILGGDVICENSVFVGGYNRGEVSRGTVNLVSGTMSVQTWLYVGGNQFGAKTNGSSVVASGGQLTVGKRIEVDSREAHSPGLMTLSNNASLVLQQGRMRMGNGILTIVGGGVQVVVPEFESVGGVNSKIVFVGDGVSRIVANSATLGYGTSLDVSGLNVANGTYTLLDAETLNHQGLFFAEGVDRNIWHLEVSPDDGTVKLVRGAGSVQHDLRVIGGAGSGMFAVGEVVSVVAEVAGPGLIFDRWQGDVGQVEDVFAPVTRLTTGEGAQTVRAVYRPVYEPHDLLVDGGSGSGSYGRDQLVELVANEARPGRKFFRWYGDGGIVDPLSPTTNYVMPGRESVVKAGYYQPENLVGDRGYHCRPCGLDLDRDGRIGVEGKDNILGRDDLDSPDEPRWDWKDPDHDNVEEDYYFVDAYAGNDVNIGTREFPLKTIQQALDRCDGAANGKEDIICIHGVFHEEISLTQSGGSGSYVRDGFEYPSDPMRIIGWDKDQDGEYPPFDRDDEAVIDGSGGLVMAVSNGMNKVSYVEIAHLVIRNFNGWSTDRTRGAIRFSSSRGGAVSHIYVHDVELNNINTGSYRNPDDLDNPDEGSERIVAVFWNGETSLRHVAMCNVLVDGYGSFFARGSPAYGSGCYRFKNLTLNCKTVDGFSITGFKIWGAHDKVEILDSVFDGQPGVWDYGNGGPRMIAVRPDQHDVTIRNNLLLHGRANITIDGCSNGDETMTRTTDDILIEGNHIVVTHNDWGTGDSRPVGIRIDPGCDINTTTEDISIRNNFIFIPIRGAVALELAPGMDDLSVEQPGNLEVVGNTIYGPGNGQNFYGILINLKNVPNPQRNIKIYNNILSNIGSGGYNIFYSYPEEVNHADILIDGNVWDPEGDFTWLGVRQANFEAWQGVSGQDAHSVLGHPVFVHAEGGELHLAPEDIVARSAGVNITGITTIDIDGEVRSADGPYAGADVQNDEFEVNGAVDHYSLLEDEKLVIAPELGVLANDGIDSPVIPPSALIVVMPAHGVLNLERDGSFVYIPDRDYHGTDVFTYRIHDPGGEYYSLPIAVSMDVRPVNDPPVAQGDSYAVYQGHVLDVMVPGVLGNDADVEGDMITAVLEEGPLYAEEFVLRGDGSFRYVVAEGTVCVDQFIYMATDGQGSSERVVVELVVGNAPTEIIVDNQDSATEQAGQWLVSSAPGFYQVDSLYADDIASFTWKPDIPIPAVYQVYVWWTYHVARSKEVPYVIRHGGGETVAYVDQLDPDRGGQWVLFGEYFFNAGVQMAVSVVARPGQQASADAIKFVRTGDLIPREIVVDNLSANIEKVGDWLASDASAAHWVSSVYSTGSSDVFKWKPVLPVDGRYGVYIWWTYRSTRSDRVPCRVAHAGGIASLELDQLDEALAGRWVHLGDYDFLANGVSYVSISGEQGQASADAVRFVRLDESSGGGGDESSEDSVGLFKIGSYCFHPDGRHVISVDAELGAVYTLQVSKDLVHWSDVETRAGTDRVMVFRSQRQSVESHLFYRVKKVTSP